MFQYFICYYLFLKIPAWGFSPKRTVQELLVNTSFCLMYFCTLGEAKHLALHVQNFQLLHNRVPPSVCPVQAPTVQRHIKVELGRH